MTDAESILRDAETILLVDWPTRDVPDSLTRAGLAVVVKGGPGPDSYMAYEVHDGEVVGRPLGEPPERADIVYFHRPFRELESILVLAARLGAGTLWRESGTGSERTGDRSSVQVPDEASREARRAVEQAGLTYVDDVYIGDAARRRNPTI